MFFWAVFSPFRSPNWPATLGKTKTTMAMFITTTIAEVIIVTSTCPAVTTNEV